MQSPAPEAKPRSPMGAYGLIALLFALGAALVARDLAGRIPPALWLPALLGQTESAAAALVHYNLLPRVAMCCLVGAALGLCGVVMQQVLRNPLAEPTTLGVSSGAGLALGIAQIWAPSLLEGGAALVSLAGAVAAFAGVAALAWRRGLSPIAMILAGLVVGLYAGAVGSALILFNHDYLIGLFIWGAGYMTQHDWSAAARLAPQVLAVALLVALMVRPLAVLGLDDETARNLGLGLDRARAVVLGASVFLAASVVSVVGIIGFVGLAAPAMARYAGARTFSQRLVAAPLLGAALLLLADRLVLLVPQGYREVPTGSVTALFGAPLILIMIARLRGDLAPERGEDAPFRRRRDLCHFLPWMAGALVLALALALVVAPGPQGWRLPDAETLAALLPWRWPRVLGALSCGVLLGVAGTLLQRLTGNAMAGPETLGITSGAAIGVIVLLYARADASQLAQTTVGALGALASLLLVLSISRRSGFNPERLLLAGVATSMAFAGVVSLFASTGDPRLASVLTWLSGSTYGIDATASLALAVSAALTLALAALLARPLALLSLGAAPAAAAGLDLRSARLLVVLLAGAASAAATLVVGPLSFVGLMAPHIARSLGLARPLDHLVGAALLGAVILTAADWAGRVAIFPYQIPTGLAATLIAGPWLIGLLLRRG